MLCHNKNRQRLKEYINYKLNKYYTVIFTLIIWAFLSFFFLFVLCSSKYWPFYFLLSSCHRWVDFTSQWTPNYENQLYRRITSKKCYVFRNKSCTVVTVLLKYVNRNSNQVGDMKPEEAATCKQESWIPTCNWNERDNWNADICQVPISDI